MIRSDLKETPLNTYLNPARVRMSGGPLPPVAPLPRGDGRSTPRRPPVPVERWREEEHWEAIAEHACRLYFPNEG